MPELPDVVTYIEALRPRIVGTTLDRVRLVSPFVLRSVKPAISEVEGRRVNGLRRLGKQIAIGLEGDLFIVIHLMIAGRFQWKEKAVNLGGKIVVAVFEFSSGTLILTEAGSKKRASIYVVGSERELKEFDRGALEVLTSTLDEFREVLSRENHTIKRSLTDPRLLSGVGNAYSDEILHRAKLSPLKLTSRMTEEEIARLHEAARTTLAEWIERLRREAGSGFPAKVTAFRPEMSVHGRYGKPCPVCGSPVQRIAYADNECNYCAVCQTNGKLLADRGLSRLLKEDWPRSLDEWDAHFELRRKGS